MKKKILAALLLTTLSSSAVVAWEGGTGQSPHPNQECDTTSTDTFPASSSVTTFSPSSPAGLCSDARRGVAEAMITASGVQCGPCEGGDCSATLSNLSTGISTGAGATFDQALGLWKCTASFNGTHKVRCLPC